jgi:heme-degrading monooxygenase HmoA
MAARIWKGYTSAANADAYEQFLKTEFLPYIEKKNIPGYKKFQLLKKQEGDETAFITIMWFTSLEKIKQFAGENYEQSIVHPKAQALLSRYDKTASHYEMAYELLN